MPIVDWCIVDSPIIFDRLNDTLTTLAAVKAHNDKWVAACGSPVTEPVPAPAAAPKGNQ